MKLVELQVVDEIEEGARVGGAEEEDEAVREAGNREGVRQLALVALRHREGVRAFVAPVNCGGAGLALAVTVDLADWRLAARRVLLAVHKTLVCLATSAPFKPISLLAF